MWFQYYFLIMIFLSFKIKEIYSVGKIYTTGNNKKFYIVDDEKYSWYDSLSECYKMNMTLASLETFEKTYEINQLVLKEFGKSKFLWVGGIATHYPEKNKFIWIRNGLPFTYTFWDDKEPNFRNSLQYCILIGWGTDMKWADYRCDIKYGFICEESPQLEMEKKYQEILNKLKQQLLVYKTNFEILETANKRLQDEVIKERLQFVEQSIKLFQVQKMEQVCQMIVEKHKLDKKEVSENQTNKDENRKYNLILQFNQHLHNTDRKNSEELTEHTIPLN